MKEILSKIKENLLEETEALVIKKDKLERFIKQSEDFENLPRDEQHLMIQQLFAMQQYIGILDKRFVAISERMNETDRLGGFGSTEK